MTVVWPDAVDEILGGDHVVMLAYATPARGVVMTPVTNFAVRDRAAGTVSVNSSVGAWKKLDRIRRDPHVALAFHTRRHATHERPEYVLVQGRATLSEPIDDYPSTVLENWERIEPWRDLHPIWKRWLRVYGRRVEISVTVERVTVWPDLECRGEPAVLGAEAPGDPEPQQPPGKGTGPRIGHRRAARAVGRLPDALLGWVGADRLPVVVPVTVAGADEGGIVLAAPPSVEVPNGGRRAGLTAHWFSKGAVGQRQRVHTGWMERGERVVYAPHTLAAYRFPPSSTLFKIVSGGATRLRLRRRPDSVR